MKNKLIFVLAFAFMLVCLLASCGTSSSSKHEHSYENATCEEPKTCEDCGKTKGEALGHSFTEATCEEPKTCSRCGKTEGYSLGHEFRDATCTKPKTCTVCNFSVGKAIGHSYSKGVCSECGSIEPGAYKEQTEILFTLIDCVEVLEQGTEIIANTYKNAWYFAMYKADSYYDYDLALADFSDYVDVQESYINSAVIKILENLGLATTKGNGLAAFATEKAVILIIGEAFSSGRVFKECDALISSFATELAKINEKVVGTELFEAFDDYITTVCDFYYFARIPDDDCGYYEYCQTVNQYKNKLQELKDILAEEME